MNIREETWQAFQQHLGYSDEEMQKFRADPRNADILSKTRLLMSKTLIATVVESHGCNTGHRAGDKFHFDGAGNLLTKYGPKRICPYALNALTPLLYAASELTYAGVDPNEMRFKRAGCSDVGVQCGGWGHIALELQVEEHKRSDAE